MARPTWDHTWMTMAQIIAHRSRCAARGVGAIIVSQDNAYSAVGYNGPPAGMDLPEDSICVEWCPQFSAPKTGTYLNCITAHAEANALIRADFSRIAGGTIYVTSACCWDCGKLIANSRLSRVVMDLDEERDMHRDPFRTIEMLETSGVQVTIWGESDETRLRRARLREVREGETNGS